MILSKNVNVYEVKGFTKGTITDLHPTHLPDDALYRTNCLIDAGWIKNGLGLYCLEFRNLSDGSQLYFNNYSLFFDNNDKLYVVESYKVWNGEYYDEYQRVWESYASLSYILNCIKTFYPISVLMSNIYDDYANYIDRKLWVKKLNFDNKIFVVGSYNLYQFSYNRLNTVINNVIDAELYEGFMILLLSNGRLKWSDYNRAVWDSGFAGEMMMNGVKLVKTAETLYIIDRNQISRIDFVGYPTIWKVYKIVNFVDNITYPYHITTDGKNIYFLANNKLYMFDGNRIIFLSYLIKEYLNEFLGVEGEDLASICLKYDNGLRSVLVFKMCTGVNNKILAYNIDLENFSFMDCRLRKISPLGLVDYEIYDYRPFNLDDVYFVNTDGSHPATFVYYNFKNDMSFVTKEYNFTDKTNHLVYKRLLRLEIIGDKIVNRVGIININGVVYNLENNVINTDVVGKSFILNFSLNVPIKISGLRFYYTMRGVV